MGLMAGYGVQLWPILQDIHQLRATYGQRAGTFLSNAGVAPPRKQPGIILCLHLCVHNVVDDIRAELSCPVGVENGFFIDFIERNILTGAAGDDGAGVRRILPDDPTEFDIPVIRR
jgi:hypothetical protein